MLCEGNFVTAYVPGTVLPELYDRALGALELPIVSQAIYRGKCLKELLPYVLCLQKHWIIEADEKPANTIGFLRRKTPANTREPLANDALDWCLVQLLAKPDDQRTFDHSMVFAMLEEHVSNNPSEKTRLDEVIPLLGQVQPRSMDRCGRHASWHCQPCFDKKRAKRYKYSGGSSTIINHLRKEHNIVTSGKRGAVADVQIVDLEALMPS